MKENERVNTAMVNKQANKQINKSVLCGSQSACDIATWFGVGPRRDWLADDQGRPRGPRSIASRAHTPIRKNLF